ncbi:MAG: ferritin family protein, partial [Planctomycetota bacterium]
DYLVKEEPNSEMDYQSALIVAMKKEKSAFRLYNDLATQTQDAGIKSALLALAQEEAKHKLRIELEYDNQVYREN